MQLRTVDGQLTLGSVYKLIVWGWILGTGSIMGGFFVLMLVVMAMAGDLNPDGDVGGGGVLLQMLPAVILLPVIVVAHAFMFGGMILFGVWLYRLRRPLQVVNVSTTPADGVG